MSVIKQRKNLSFQNHDFLDGTEFQNDDATQFETNTNAHSNAIDTHMEVEPPSYQNILPEVCNPPSSIVEKTTMKSIKV